MTIRLFKLELSMLKIARKNVTALENAAIVGLKDTAVIQMIQLDALDLFQPPFRLKEFKPLDVLQMYF